MKMLIYGSTGWIGSQLLYLLREKDINIFESSVRLENYHDIKKELDIINPTHVLLAAGLTGMPNIDWCEDNKEKVVSVNIIGTSILADECRKKNIHLTYLGTGCIYEYDDTHTIENKIGFVEDDIPNFEGSFYSKTKIIIENILKLMNNVLILRIRMPLSDDLHPRNFITKIIKYKKVINIPNSMTVLNDLLPVVIDMLLKSKTGIYNFTNPGLITHNEILTLYKKYIDPSFEWSNFTLDELSNVIKGKRSNNCLDSSKLCLEYPAIENISVSIIKLFERMSNKLK